MPETPAKAPATITPIMVAKAFILTLLPTMRGFRILLSKNYTTAMVPNTIKMGVTSGVDESVSITPIRLPNNAPT